MKKLIFFNILLLLTAAYIFAVKPNTGYKPTTREYYIAIEPTEWDYMPDKIDPLTGVLPDAPWTKKTIYNKIRYIEYEDSTFTKRKAQDPSRGILGPEIRAVVGDKIHVNVINRSDGEFSLHPHGLRYDKFNDGATHNVFLDKLLPKAYAHEMATTTDPDADILKPGASYTYHWEATPSSGPQENEGGSKVWLYHSHVDPDLDPILGLVGTIIVLSPDYVGSDLKPTDVDKEFTQLYMIFDENNPNAPPEDQNESDIKHTINGKIFHNTHFEMTEGDRVRWYTVALGSEQDIHTAHWHAHTVKERSTGRVTDVIELLPATMRTVDMVADNPGSWMLHCHVGDHVEAGMVSYYTVIPKNGYIKEWSKDEKKHTNH
jgi:manganese oxidase